MTTRSDPAERGGLTSLMHQLYLALCWSLLIVTAAAACLSMALLAGMVLQAIWPG